MASRLTPTVQDPHPPRKHRLLNPPTRMDRRSRQVDLRSLMARVHSSSRPDPTAVQRWVLGHPNLSGLLEVSGAPAAALAKMNSALLANHVLAPHSSDQSSLRLLDATEMCEWCPLQGANGQGQRMRKMAFTPPARLRAMRTSFLLPRSHASARSRVRGVSPGFFPRSSGHSLHA